MLALEDMSHAEIKSALRDLFHLRGEAALAVDVRNQELPYHPLLGIFREADDSLREKIERAVIDLVTETPTYQWTTSAVHYLFTFTEEARIGAAREPLIQLVHSGAFESSDDRLRRQILALRTLLGLGWLGTPQFWLGLSIELERAFPTLILRALAKHDLELATDAMPSLVRTPADAVELLRLLPSWVELFGMARVRESIGRELDRLKPEVRTELVNWFSSRQQEVLPTEQNAELVARNGGINTKSNLFSWPWERQQSC